MTSMKTPLVMQKFFRLQQAVIWSLVLVLLGCKNGYDESCELSRLETLCWEDLQAAGELMSSMDTVSLSSTERNYYRLMKTHIAFRRHPHRVSEEVAPLPDIFEAAGKKAWAGEAYYIIGASEELEGKVYSAILSLKHAEHLLTEGDAPAVWLGVTYYKMGAISERERLNEQAQVYYGKALDYLQSSSLDLFLACTYRDLARLSEDARERERLFDSASYYAARTDNPVFINELRYKYASEKGNEEEAMRYCMLLVDSLQQYRYAHIPAAKALEENDREKAGYYLSLLANDTAHVAWSRNRWHYLHAQLLAAGHKAAEGLAEMTALYDGEMRLISETGKTRTYAITERYDLNLVQQQNLRLTIRQQQDYLIIGLLIIGFLLLLIVILYLNAHRKRTQSALEATQRDLRIKRDSLSRILKHRVHLTQNIHLSKRYQKNRDEMPVWLKNVLADNLLTEWEDLEKEFNSLYNDMLVHIKEQHPSLTPMDLKMIALITLGLDVADICLLLNQTKRTIWSRRQRIKKHLGLANGSDLEDWVAEQIRI